MEETEKKAKELVDKFFNNKSNVMTHAAAINESKQCALICIEEIIASNPREPENNISVPLYWLEVKVAIKNL